MPGANLSSPSRILLASVLVLGAISRPGVAFGVSAPAAAECPPSLQSLIDAAVPGSTVSVPACVYRETVTIDKRLILAGEPGAEIRGSDLWTDWQAHVDGSWVSAASVPRLPVVSDDSNACEPNTANRCLASSQVYVDGVALDLADGAGHLGPGKFAIDPARRVVLAEDPTGHTVEVTTRARWIVTAADGVTIQGMTLRQAGNSAGAGGVSNDGRSNWTLQDSTVSDAHSANVSLNGGSNVSILRNDIAHAGLVGISASHIDVGGVVRGNHIHDNRTTNASFNRDWGAGGLKLTVVRDVVVDANETDHNDGIGLWCDIGCLNVTFSNNRVHHNQWQGINFEISDSARIHGNVLWENGWGKPAWGWGAGIVISSSANAEVFNNTAAWNYAGITVLYQNRPSSPGPDPVGNYVHDNNIIKKVVTGDFSQTYWYNLSLAWLSDGSKPMFDPSWNNVALDNRVWYDEPERQSIRFSWSSQYFRLAEFGDTVGGTGTRYLSTEAKDQLLSDLNVPLAPES
jgi:Right handed beta helix region